LEDLLPLWEHTVLRLAAVLIAAGVVARYVLHPIGRAAVRGWRLVHTAADKLEQVNQIIARELTRNGGSSMVDKVNALHAQIGTVTDDVAQVRGDLTSKHAELTAHINDVRRAAEKLEEADEAAEVSWIKYVFEHRRDHKEMHRWLAETFGVDRRGSQPPFDPETGEFDVERRGE
jgi:hypothetical protein